ncbi:hypothetical protein [Burkholderia ubonensis]|uniref:hypothetical protein n=2 Tax=Burkholderia ubonensis TaxID=101571 RepID=UPI0012FC3329|nr:hypothetical protein [Burkholderia ubonensis]
MLLREPHQPPSLFQEGITMPNAAPKLPPVAQPSQQFSLNAPRNATPLNSPWPKPQGGRSAWPLKVADGKFSADVFKTK